MGCGKSDPCWISTTMPKFPPRFNGPEAASMLDGLWYVDDSVTIVPILNTFSLSGSACAAPCAAGSTPASLTRRHGQQTHSFIARDSVRICLLYASPSPRDRG